MGSSVYSVMSCSVLKGSRLQVLCGRNVLGGGGVEAGRGADTCVRRGASQMALIYPCQDEAGKEPRLAGRCLEASTLLGPWEAGPLPWHLSSVGKQGWQRLGDAGCSSSSAISALSFRADLLLAVI